IHDIDLALWFFGPKSRVKSVVASGITAVQPGLRKWGDRDNAVGIVEFHEGKIAYLFASRMMAAGQEDSTEVIGTEGKLTVNMQPQLNLVHIYEKAGVRREFPATYYERFEDAFVKEANEFTAICLDGGELPMKLEGAVQAVRIACALQESLVSGEKIWFDGEGRRMERKSRNDVSFRDDPIVQLRVGPGGTIFNVHQGLICDLSKVFKAAFTGEFQENSGSMTLPDDDAIQFDHLVRWLYKRSLDTFLQSAVESGKFRWIRLFEIYLLADRYDIVPLKNDIMDLCFNVRERRRRGEKSYRALQLEDVKYVLENTLRGSQLRRFVVVWATWHVGRDWCNREQAFDWLESVPELSTELVIALSSRLQGSEDPFNDRQSFHEHVSQP
ncbi:MAG: hypothetical protein Q9224_006229, partial [Gallowayella concinna]